MPSKTTAKATEPKSLAEGDVKDRAARIVKLLKKEYPEVTCALVHDSPFELLIATILSAQCTDERVNIVTKDLFAKYSTPAELVKRQAAAWDRWLAWAADRFDARLATTAGVSPIAQESDALARFRDAVAAHDDHRVVVLHAGPSSTARRWPPRASRR